MTAPARIAVFVALLAGVFLAGLALGDLLGLDPPGGRHADPAHGSSKETAFAFTQQGFER